MSLVQVGVIVSMATGRWSRPPVSRASGGAGVLAVNGAAYAVDLANFAGSLAERSLELGHVAPTDVFDYLDWQARQVAIGGKVVALRRRGPAPSSTMNRRIAAVRGLFEHLVMTGGRAGNPVPAARRASGLRGQRSGLLGHVAVRQRAGERFGA